MKVTTSRFGEIQVNNEDVLTFPDGLLGFDSLRKFFIVDPSDATLILWLQSVEDPKVAFPVIEPKIFKPDYVAKLMPTDLASLELENLDNAKVYSILTIPSNVTEMSSNLKAPVIINGTKNIAKQIVLQDNKLSVKHEMYKELKTFISNFASDDTRRTKVELPILNKPSVEAEFPKKSNSTSIGKASTVQANEIDT